MMTWELQYFSNVFLGFIISTDLPMNVNVRLSLHTFLFCFVFSSTEYSFAFIVRVGRKEGGRRVTKLNLLG